MAWLSKKHTPADHERAFMEQVFVHWEGLMRYATRLCRDEVLAEDIVQEAMTRAYPAFTKLRDTTNLRAWSYTIVRNAFLSRARKRGRELSLEDPSAIVDRGPHPDADMAPKAMGGLANLKRGFEDEVYHALQSLSEAQRSAVLLCDVEGLSYDEIAHVLGCPLGTVRSRIHSARRHLRASLDGYAEQKGYRNAQ